MVKMSPFLILPLMTLSLVTLSSMGHGFLTENGTGTIPISNLCGMQAGNANREVDYLLQGFKSTLPSRVNLTNFDDQLAHSCYLTGLDSGVNRYGDAVLEISDLKATFTFGISSGKITIQCSWWYKLGLINFSGSVKAFTEKVSARAKVGMNLGPGAHPALEEFKVTELDKIKTDVRGLSVLNWIGEKVLNRKIDGARDTIIKQMEETVARRLQEKLDKFSLPSQL